MMVTIRRLVVVAVAAALALLTMQLEASEPESLSVTVRVLDHAGQPVKDIEVLVGHSVEAQGPVGSGQTDDAGNAVIVLPRAVAQTSLCVILSDGIGAIDGGAQIARNKAYWSLIKANAWDSPQWFPLEAGVAERTVTVAMRPAISVRGRMTGPVTPGSGKGFVIRRNAEQPAPADRHTREFRLYGVPRGEPTELLFFGDYACVHWISLTAEQTAADLDLGEISTGCGTRDAIARITFDSTNWTSRASVDLIPGVTLIRSDGSKIMNFVSNANGIVETDIPGSSSPDLPIPSGTWYLVPGVFNPAVDLSLRAFDLVRSGQTHLVPDWPTITVALGETETATAHAAALDAAIRATMPPE
jgi:hypothetical protein